MSTTAAEAQSDLTPAQPGLGQRLVAAVGSRVTAFISYLGEIFLLANQTVQHILRGEVTRREAFDQMLQIGVGSLPLVALTVSFSGMVLGIYGVSQFKRFGLTEMIGQLAAMSIAREVAPVLTATVVAARSGSAIAAEVGTMKITEQLDALRALATDPVEYLAVPRYVALVLMLPMLTLVGTVLGTLGAGLVANLQGIPWQQYLTSIYEGLPLDYVVHGCVKGMIFGALIAVASLRQGFRCGFGTVAVGRATTQAVVLNILWIHFSNLLLATVTK